MSELRQRLAAARLYLVTPDQDDTFLDGALRGGVDVVQLREKSVNDDDAILATARRFRRVCDVRGALFVINDRPELVRAANADGVHLGQHDMPATQARVLVGEDALIGLSTHSPEQIDAAAEQPVDYIGVGPVYATPTKPGRPAVGLELVRYAAEHSSIPFFAIGGIDPRNIAGVRDAGGRRVAVVRAITEAADPLAAARELSTAAHKLSAAAGELRTGERVGAT